MTLVIGFAGELIPFVMHDSDAEVMHAIEKAKEMFYFSREVYEIRDDFVYLYAHTKGEKRKNTFKRLYVLHDKVILQTDTRYPDEVEPTRKLLAYENNCRSEDIYVVTV